MTTLILLIVLAVGYFQPVEPLPLAQVQVEERLFLRAEPHPSAENSGRARWGDTLLIYEIEGEWGRTSEGWVWLRELTLTPAVVQYSAIVRQEVSLRSTLEVEPSQNLKIDTAVGVLALYYDQALLYSPEGVGWGERAALEIIPPTPDLLDFGDQAAYVQVLGATLYASPEADPLAEIPLGRAVSIVAQQEEWVLVRATPFYGWALASQFDRLPLAIGRGSMNAGPINLRAAPVDGAVINALDYQEPLLILGRDEAGEWLFVRVTKQGRQLDGWVAAEFVTFDGRIDDLPEMD